MGERIYYTGDMANEAGWFVAERSGANLHLTEEPGAFFERKGRRFTIPAHHVGDVYRGHCNPRFVTEVAYQTYRRECEERFRPDARVFSHGSLYTVLPLTDAASDWIMENTPDDAPFIGEALAVEHRCITDLVGGMRADGLVVVVGA